MRNLTFKQLDALVAISRSGTLASAADKLGLTASALTTRLKELEQVAGFTLFDRTSQGMRVNQAGMIMLEVANRASLAVDFGSSSLAELRGVTAGTVAIGINSTAKYFAPRLIAAFSRLYPGVNVSLTVGNRQDIMAAFQSMRIDLAIMGRPAKHLHLVARPFGEHPLVIIAPPTHALVRRRRLKRAELASEPFLMREEGSGTRTVFEQFFGGRVDRHGRFAIEIGSNETIKQGVMAGLGLALISAHTIAAELEVGRLAVLDVDSLPIMRQWFIARRSDHAQLPAMKAFWQFTIERGAEHLPVNAIEGKRTPKLR